MIIGVVGCSLEKPDGLGLGRTCAGFGKKIGVELSWLVGMAEDIGTGLNPDPELAMQMGEGLIEIGDGVMPSLMVSGEGENVCESEKPPMLPNDSGEGIT